MNYVINSLSYVTVFRLKDWTFVSALLFVINNIYAIVTGSLFKKLIFYRFLIHLFYWKSLKQKEDATKKGKVKESDQLKH